MDNGSSDGTRELVERFKQDHGKHIRYMCESRHGLHWARHSGARAARGEILAYTDDDAVVSVGWLNRLLPVYQDPQIGAAGGPIMVQWRTPPPSWVPSLGSFGHLDYGRDFLKLSWPQTINGGNFSVRKDTLFEVGGFNPDTSVQDRLVGDGEVGLCRKLYAAGWKIAYVPNATVYHIQDGELITLSTMKHRYAQIGRFRSYTNYQARRQSRLQLLWNVTKTICIAARWKFRALWHVPKKDRAYYTREVNATAAMASTEYYLRLLVSKQFRQVVLREDWINDGY